MVVLKVNGPPLVGIGVDRSRLPATEQSSVEVGSGSVSTSIDCPVHPLVSHESADPVAVIEIRLLLAVADTLTEAAQAD